MLKNIILTKTEYTKQGDNWEQVATNTKPITQQFYNNIIGARAFFENLGGVEHHTKKATRFGRMVAKVESINPSQDYKSIYDFDFSKAITD